MVSWLATLILSATLISPCHITKHIYRFRELGHECLCGFHYSAYHRYPVCKANVHLLTIALIENLIILWHIYSVTWYTIWQESGNKENVFPWSSRVTELMLSKILRGNSSLKFMPELAIKVDQRTLSDSSVTSSRHWSEGWQRWAGKPMAINRIKLLI